MLSRANTLKIVQADLGTVAEQLKHADDALHRRGLYYNPKLHARYAIVGLEEIIVKLKRVFTREA